MAPGDGHELPYVSVSKGNFEILLRELLLVKNYRVEVFTSKGRSNDWVIEFKASPGNLEQFESILFNNADFAIGTSIIAVNIKQIGQQRVSRMMHLQM